MEGSGIPVLFPPYALKSVIAASSMFCRFWHSWSVHWASVGIGRKQKHNTKISLTAALFNLVPLVEKWTRIKLSGGQRRECPDAGSVSRVRTTVNSYSLLHDAVCPSRSYLGHRTGGNKVPQHHMPVRRACRTRPVTRLLIPNPLFLAPNSVYLRRTLTSPEELRKCQTKSGSRHLQTAET